MTNVGRKIRQLIKFRYTPVGHIGEVIHQYESGEIRVNLSWNKENSLGHFIHLKPETEGEFWEWAQE